MSNFSVFPNKRDISIEVIEFRYIYFKIDGNENFIFLEGDEPKEILKKAHIGKVYIRIPTWVEMHDIFRISTKRDVDPAVAHKKRRYIDAELFKDAKLKKLCIKFVDHEGEETIVDNDYIDELNVRLAGFVLQKIDEIISKYYTMDGISEKEAKDLSTDCYKYYSSIFRKQSGELEDVPTPPSIIILKHVCDMFKCTPDVARTISKRDIDMINIAEEQQSLCRNPGMIGLDKNFIKPR